MKVLFYCVTHYSPFIETELELIKKHLNKGDEVFILRCTNQLQTCYTNPCHYKSNCLLCQGRFSEGLKRINFPERNIIIMPKLRLPYDILPKQFKDISELKKYKYRGIDLGLCVASSLVSRLNKDHRLDTVKYKKDVSRELKNSFYVYHASKKVLREIKPDLTYALNGRLSEIRPFLRACQELKIHFFTHEVGSRNDRYTIYEDSFPHDINFLTNEIQGLWKAAGTGREEMAKQYFNNKRKANKKYLWYCFTENQRKLLLPKEFDSKKTNIVIFNSTIEEYVGLEGWDNLIYRDENDGIKQIVESFKNDNNIQFYLRIHPNLASVMNTDNSQLQEIEEISRNHKNIINIQPDSPISSYALLDKADKVIVFGSSIGTEASYWGKPTISLARAIYENLDCCYRPKNHQEAIKMIADKNLEPKNKNNALKYGFWEMTRGVAFQHFKALSANRGEFMGSIIKPGFLTYIKILFCLPFESRSYRVLIVKIKFWRKNAYII